VITRMPHLRPHLFGMFWFAARLAGDRCRRKGRSRASRRPLQLTDQVISAADNADREGALNVLLPVHPDRPSAPAPPRRRHQSGNKGSMTRLQVRSAHRFSVPCAGRAARPARAATSRTMQLSNSTSKREPRNVATGPPRTSIERSARERARRQPGGMLTPCSRLPIWATTVLRRIGRSLRRPRASG
jgi:hypothetical protein